jgi:hypothetical protein
MENSGSARTRELAAEARRRLGGDIPAEARLLRYAALLAAAEAYEAWHGAAAYTAWLNEHEAEGGLYGVDGRADPAAAKAARDKGRRAMKRLLPLARRAEDALAKLAAEYRAVENDLPEDLRELGKPAISAARINARRLRFAAEGSGPDLPAEPAGHGGWTKAQLALTWWGWLARYPGKREDIPRLAWAWRLSDSGDEEGLRRYIRKIRNGKGRAIPYPWPWLGRDDLPFFGGDPRNRKIAQIREN